MNKSLLILVLIVTTVTSLSLPLPTRLPLLKIDPIKSICDAVKNNPMAANRIFQNLQMVFADSTANQKFPLTIAYINEQSTQLLAGGDLCRSFFNGLLEPFRNDLLNNKQNIQNIQQQLMQLIQSRLPQIVGFRG